MHCQLEAILDPGFFEDVHEMHLHRAGRDGKGRGDFLVLQAGADMMYDFALARREPRRTPSVQGRILSRKRALDPDISLPHRTQTLNYSFHRKGLLEDSTRAQLERTEAI